MTKSCCAVVLALVMGACGSESPTESDPVPTEPVYQYVKQVEVIFESYHDHNPTASNGDWITFSVRLVEPDGSLRECALQSTVIRPYGSDCPNIGSTVDQLGPRTYRAYLYNVWINTDTESSRHAVTAGETVDLTLDSARPFLETGNNISVAGAYDEEVVARPGNCGNCVYGKIFELQFRIRGQ